MIIEIAALMFATTGVFSGSASCEKTAEGASLYLQMNVESNSAQVPADSISSAMAKVFEATKTLGLKRTNISIQESSEGRQNNQNKNKDEAKEYFANKSIKITTRDFEEIQPLLQSAAEAGFLMSGTIEYFLTNSDSLKSACIDKAVKIALERAKVAKKALNGLSMSVLKITDSDDFDLYTSDDTKTDEEGIDKFFTNRRQYGFAAGRAGMARGPQLFYKISPAKIKVNSAIRILVKITTNE